MLSNGWWFHAHWNLICISFAYISMNPAAGSSGEIALYRSRLMPWFAYANEPFKRNCDGNFLKIVLAVSWIYFGNVNWINFLFVTGGADRKWRRTQSHTGSHQSNAIAQSSLRSQKVIHHLKKKIKKIQFQKYRLWSMSENLICIFNRRVGCVCNYSSTKKKLNYLWSAFLKRSGRTCY